MRSAARLLPLAAVLAFAAPAHTQPPDGCRSWGRGGDRATFCEIRESTLAATGALSVDAGTNGGVTVRAYEGREIRVRAEVRTVAPTDQAAREMARGIRVNAAGSRITTTGPAQRGNLNWGVSYEILVPARTGLTVQTMNGPISVEGVAGTMRLRTTNGPIGLTNVSGDVNGRTSNGPVNVTLSGQRWSGGGLDVETTNGPVNVRIPRGYGAHVRASTTHGPIRVPASMGPRQRDERRPWSPPRPVDMDLNGGGPLIRTVTTNGPVTITEI